MDELAFAGGNNTAEVVRVGDTARRSRGARSAFVAELLTELKRSGFPHAPRSTAVSIPPAGTSLLAAILRRQRYIARISRLRLRAPDRPAGHYEHQRRAIAWAQAHRAPVATHLPLFRRALA